MWNLCLFSSAEDARIATGKLNFVAQGEFSFFRLYRVDEIAPPGIWVSNVRMQLCRHLKSFQPAGIGADMRKFPSYTELEQRMQHQRPSDSDCDSDGSDWTVRGEEEDSPRYLVPSPPFVSTPEHCPRRRPRCSSVSGPPKKRLRTEPPSLQAIKPPSDGFTVALPSNSPSAMFPVVEHVDDKTVLQDILNEVNSRRQLLRACSFLQKEREDSKEVRDANHHVVLETVRQRTLELPCSEQLFKKTDQGSNDTFFSHPSYDTAPFSQFLGGLLQDDSLEKGVGQ